MAKKQSQVPAASVNPDDLEDQLDFTGTPYEESGKHDEITAGGDYLIPRGRMPDGKPRLVRVDAKGDLLDAPEDETEEETDDQTDSATDNNSTVE